MSSTKKTYDKFFIKRDPKSLVFITKDGNPVAGEKERTARLHEATAEQLNISWENSGVIYVLAEGQPKAKAQEKEKEDNSVINAMKKDDLISNLEQLELPTDSTIAILKQRLIQATQD